MICYTDGATSKNGSEDAVGGWAFAIVDDNGLVFSNSGHLKNTTNNICELTAVLNACNYLKEVYPFDEHFIYIDSAYVVNCYTLNWYQKWEKNGWINSKKQPVANRELWIQLIEFFKDKNFHFKKVAGHSTNEWNNYVDKLAVKAKELDNA